MKEQLKGKNFAAFNSEKGWELLGGGNDPSELRTKFKEKGYNPVIIPIPPPGKWILNKLQKSQKIGI